MASEIIFFDNGNQNTAITGGFGGGVISGGASYNIGDALHLDCPGSGGYRAAVIYSKKMIDVTPLKKIKFSVRHRGESGTYRCGISNNQSESNYSKLEAFSPENDPTSTADRTYEIDVSEMTGNYNIKVSVSESSGATEWMSNADFYKIWGELKNTPPTISGTPASGSNLGTKTTGFNVTYTVNDAEGDTVTVKEYLDNVLQRSYTATRGATNTIQCVTAANFQTVLNGAHTLKVVANDGKVDSAAYTVTFTKKVKKATITLTNPLNANAAIQVMVLAITGSLPADAKLAVLVTNNAKDSSPVWEDATADVKRGSNYIFTNKTAANGHWYNFKITVERGASDTGGYISGIGGAFE